MIVVKPRCMYWLECRLHLQLANIRPEYVVQESSPQVISFSNTLIIILYCTHEKFAQNKMLMLHISLKVYIYIYQRRIENGT